MTTTNDRRPRAKNDVGAALVELPMTFIAIGLFALCLTAIGQVMLEYHHVSGASRAAARYATKSDYDPMRSPASTSRRPEVVEVVAFGKQAADPLPAAEVAVDVTPDDIAGAGVTVTVSHVVDGAAYDLVTSTANAFLRVLTLDPLPPVTVRASSTAIYE